MNPSNRASLIIGLLHKINELETFREADIIFSCFGLQAPDRSSYDHDQEWRILSNASNETLIELADHFGIAPNIVKQASRGPECWQDSNFRVFISHLTTNKHVAHSLADGLEYYGFDCFVAHDDIEPTREWQLEIQSALRSCDYMIAVITPGFRDSPWCDQEIGAAVGRSVPVFSLHYSEPPHGFAGMYQGLNVTGRKTGDVIPMICTAAVKHPSTTVKGTSAIVQSIRHSRSYSQSNALAAILNHCISLDPSSAQILHEALTSNSEVSGAFDAADTIPKVLSKFGYSINSESDDEYFLEDDVPF